MRMSRRLLQFPSLRSRRLVRRASLLGFESLETRSLLSNFLVNSGYTLNDQSHPSVSVNTSTGASIAVWESYDQVSSSSGYDIFGQLYNSNGSPNGSAFRVNDTTVNDQQNPSVSMNTQGNFIVVWQSNNQISSTSQNDIIGKYYTASGATSGEFLVNTTTVSQQTDPYVALNASNQFAVTWISEGQGPIVLGSNSGGSTGPGGVGQTGGGGGGGGAGSAARSGGGAGSLISGGTPGGGGGGSGIP